MHKLQWKLWNPSETDTIGIKLNLFLGLWLTMHAPLTIVANCDKTRIWRREKSHVGDVSTYI